MNSLVRAVSGAWSNGQLSDAMVARNNTSAEQARQWDEGVFLAMRQGDRKRLEQMRRHWLERDVEGANIFLLS